MRVAKMPVASCCLLVSLFAIGSLRQMVPIAVYILQTLHLLFDKLKGGAP